MEEKDFYEDNVMEVEWIDIVIFWYKIDIKL